MFLYHRHYRLQAYHLYPHKLFTSFRHFSSTVKTTSAGFTSSAFLKADFFSDFCVKMLRTYKNYRFYRKKDIAIFSATLIK